MEETDYSSISFTISSHYIKSFC